MQFNKEKVININDFLKQLHERLKTRNDSDALIFFECFLQNSLIESLRKYAVPNWDGSVNAGDFDKIYPFAVEILHNSASGNFNELSNTYKDAHVISIAFCEELNEIFECSGDMVFDLIPIKSFVDIATEEGVVVIENGFVCLTAEGKEIAQNVKKEIEDSQN